MTHSSSVLRSTVSVVCQIPIVLHLHTFITILALFILFACFSAKFLLFYLGGWFFLLNMLPFRTLKKIKKTKHHPSNPSYSMQKALFKFWYINPSLSCSSRDYNKKTEKLRRLTSALLDCDWKNTASLWPHLKQKVSHYEVNHSFHLQRLSLKIFALCCFYEWHNYVGHHTVVLWCVSLEKTRLDF